MLRINSEQVKKRANELQNFKGFLPFQFDSYVSLTEREQFLKDNGLWESVHNEDLKVMKGIRDTKPNDDVYLEKILKKWLVNNPQFKELVTID